jgi:hypothetical protein
MSMVTVKRIPFTRQHSPFIMDIFPENFPFFFVYDKKTGNFIFINIDIDIGIKCDINID